MRFSARAALCLAAIGVAAGAALVPASQSLAATAPSLSLNPSSGLHDGESVTVTGSHFAPNKTYYMLQCSGSTEAECAIGSLVNGSTSASGAFTTSFTVHTGAIGSGTCNATSTNCLLVTTTDTNPSDTAAAAKVTLKFGAQTKGPAITVTPDTAVKNNAVVSVSGSGFPKNQPLYLVECSSLVGQAGCDLKTLNSSAKTN